MNRIFLLALCIFGLTGVKAQDLDKINDMLGKSQFTQAKAAIDKYTTDPKNAKQSEGWYYKGFVYNSYSFDKSINDTAAYSLKSDAFEAFKKYQVMEPNDIRLKLEQYGSYLNLYSGLYDLGAKLYNDKNYEAAYNAFKKAGEVEQYILDKKYTYTQASLHSLDTTLVFYTAMSATQAKKTDEGVSYYKRLVDANIGGKDYESVYEYLVDYYSKKNDQASLQPVLDKAKKFYPQNSSWTNLELSTLAAKGDNTTLYAKYDEMLAKDPTNYNLAYGYAVELYNSVVGKPAKTPAEIAIREKLVSVLKIAIAADTGIDATILMVNHLFNSSADMLDASNAIKSTKPEDVKKKAELKTAANAKMDETITYAEKAIKFYESRPTLKPIQKANYKIVLDHMSELYGVKNNPKKVAEFDAKNKAADKL